MKVILYMAQTVNGIIAREDFEEDFLSHDNWITFSELAEDAGCFIIGRNTYNVVQKWVGYTFDDIDSTRIVVSKNKNLKLPSGYILAKSPKDALKKAESMGYKKIILTGGSHINSAFIKQELVDEVILNIEPFILGKGISLFSQDDFENKLRLLSSKKLEHGIMQLRYKIIS